MTWKDSDLVKAVLLGAGLFLLWHFYQIAFLLFASILLAVAFSGVINYTQQKTNLSRVPSAFIAYTAILVLVVGSSMLLAPSITAQYESFKASLPSALENLQDTIATFNIDIPKTALNPTNYEFFSVSTATNTLSSSFSVIVDIIFIFILGVYFAGNPGQYLKLTRKFLNEKQIEGMHQNLKWWLASRFASMLTVAILTSIGLFILGVPFSLVLGLLAGFLSFIPNLGPILAFIPAGVIAAVSGIDTVLLTAALYVAVQLLESYLITPQIEKRTINVQAGVSLTTQLIMGTVFGFMGLLLAVPTLVAVRAYFEER